MRVAVVGAGALGLLSAYELLKRNIEVTLYHAEPDCQPASWAGGGILSPLFPWRYPDAVTRLTRQALADYQALARHIDSDFEILPQGLLVDTDEQQSVTDWARRFDLECEPVTPGQWGAAWSQARGWYFPDLGSIRNPRLLHALTDWLARHGVTFVRDQVAAVEERGQMLAVRGTRQTQAYDQVVIAAGAWSQALLAPWGVELPLFPVKGQMLLWQTDELTPSSVYLTQEGYFIPRAQGLCLFGSTIEPHCYDSVPTREGFVRLCERARRLQPALEGREPLAVWAGVRPGNERDCPYIFAADSLRRLWVNTGHYRNGLVAAPASARLLVEQMCGETPSLDPAPYLP